MELETDRLAALVVQKHRFLTQLHDLGRLQLELVDAQLMGDLLRVLSAKQRLLGGLTDVERQLDAFLDQPAESRTWRSEDERRRCAAFAEDCRRLLSEIMTQEKASEEKMIRYRDQTSEQLHATDTARTARGAYADLGPATYGQLDLVTPS